MLFRKRKQPEPSVTDKLRAELNAKLDKANEKLDEVVSRLRQVCPPSQTSKPAGAK